ncbi:MAG TPA: hypothetical protein VLM19_07110 [Nitrospiraceae bacterium]|nr:hypothetical protein [Nitrospiraceae bacterium]
MAANPSPNFMSYLTVPNQPSLNEALGRLAIAHTHLELILRYCVKTIADLTIQQALDATEGDRLSDLRVRIKQLFKERRPTALEKANLDALLGQAKRLSEMRHSFLHSEWSETAAGKTIMKGEDHQWGPAPSEKQILDVVKELTSLVAEINEARLTGFIKNVVARFQVLQVP